MKAESRKMKWPDGGVVEMAPQETPTTKDGALCQRIPHIWEVPWKRSILWATPNPKQNGMVMG